MTAVPLDISIRRTTADQPCSAVPWVEDSPSGRCILRRPSWWLWQDLEPPTFSSRMCKVLPGSLGESPWNFPARIHWGLKEMSFFPPRDQWWCFRNKWRKEIPGATQHTTKNHARYRWGNCKSQYAVLRSFSTLFSLSLPSGAHLDVLS